jgi:tetratricopeptide (TPR) repeat protein
LLPVALLLAACATIPSDPVAGAQQAIERGDLYAALLRLDEVPPPSPRYAEARALASAIERRMRRSHELLVRGLDYRGEHRDDEAQRCFEEALSIWPELEAGKQLLAATRGRKDALATRTIGDTSRGAVVVTTETVEDRKHSSEEPAAASAAAPGLETTPTSLPSDEAGRAARLLAEAGRLVERGELDLALEVLGTQGAEIAADSVIGHATLRILRQRGLLRYGQGRLDEAIADWSRVLQLLPADPQAQQFLAAARNELNERRRK